MLRLRALTEDERKTIERLVHARATPVGKLKRAQIIWLASQGHLAPAIAQQLGVGADMVRLRLKRFNEQGLSGLEEAPRSGRPTTYTPKASERRYPDGPLQAAGAGRGLRQLDAGSARRLLAAGQRHSHEAQSHQRDLHR
jgi:hypothetical protein